MFKSRVLRTHISPVAASEKEEAQTSTQVGGL